jgi:hypothetical protein
VSGIYTVWLRVVYYESINREIKIKPIYECRCDGRLQTKRLICSLAKNVVYYESIEREPKIRSQVWLVAEQVKFI